MSAISENFQGFGIHLFPRCSAVAFPMIHIMIFYFFFMAGMGGKA